MAEIKWRDASAEKPPRDLMVLVDGGVAQWTRDTLTGEPQWRSLTGFEFPGSPIQWEVTHWAYLPTPPARGLEPHPKDTEHG